MRVTQKMTSDNALYNIQQTRSRLDRLNQQAASSRNISRPGEDPIATRQLLDLDAKMRQGEQYRSNIVKANLWQKITDTALTGMSSVLSQTRQLAATITNGSSDPTIRQNAIEQFKALKQQMIDMANTENGEQYVFGGFETRNQPFNKTNNTYLGSADAMSVEIGQNTSMQMNVRGDELLLGTGSYGSVDILQTFDDLINSVTANNAAGIQTAATAIEGASSQINNASSEVASRTIRLASMDNLHQNQHNALLSIYSNIQTIDLAKIATELQQEQIAFEAALSATAKISQLSLLDYL